MINFTSRTRESTQISNKYEGNSAGTDVWRKTFLTPAWIRTTDRPACSIVFVLIMLSRLDSNLSLHEHQANWDTCHYGKYIPGLPTSWSPTLFSGSGPVGLPTTCTLDWKKQLKGRHFSSDAGVIAAVETCLGGQPSEFLFQWLAKVRANG